MLKCINPFHDIGLFLWPLKTSKNVWCFDICKKYRKKTVAGNGLHDFFPSLILKTFLFQFFCFSDFSFFRFFYFFDLSSFSICLLFLICQFLTSRNRYIIYTTIVFSFVYNNNVKYLGLNDMVTLRVYVPNYLDIFSFYCSSLLSDPVLVINTIIIIYITDVLSLFLLL